MNNLELKKILKENNLTYQKLSEISEVSVDTIKKFMAGQTLNLRKQNENAIIKAINEYRKQSPAPLVTPYLTEEEEEIVNIYKNLSERDKELFLTVARRMNSNTEKFRSMGRNLDEL